MKTKKRKGTNNTDIYIYVCNNAAAFDFASVTHYHHHHQHQNWPLTIYNWPLTIYNSQFTIDHWPLTIDHWHLTIDHWQLTIDNCPSTIYNCTLAIAWSLLRKISFVPYDFQWLRSPKLFHFWIIGIHTPYALICMFSADVGSLKSSREQIPRGSVYFHTSDIESLK